MTDRTTRVHYKKTQQGLSIVEFALILPIILALVFGSLTYTAALYNKAVLTYASRQAVRSWVVTKPILSHIAVQQIASSYCQFTVFATGGNQCVPVAIGPDVPVPGDLMTVSVGLNFTGMYIFGSMQINAQTSMVFE